jgi:hypothetical protein
MLVWVVGGVIIWIFAAAIFFIFLYAAGENDEANRPVG